jgi:hypothetical protein
LRVSTCHVLSTPGSCYPELLPYFHLTFSPPSGLNISITLSRKSLLIPKLS